MFTGAQGQAANELMAVLEIVGDRDFKKKLKASVEATTAHDKAREGAKKEKTALGAEKAAMAAERAAMDAEAVSMDERATMLRRSEADFEAVQEEAKLEGIKSANAAAAIKAKLERDQKALADGWREIEAERGAMVLANSKAKQAEKLAVDAMTKANAKEAEHETLLDKLKSAMG